MQRLLEYNFYVCEMQLDNLLIHIRAAKEQIYIKQPEILSHVVVEKLNALVV